MNGKMVRVLLSVILLLLINRKSVSICTIINGLIVSVFLIEESMFAKLIKVINDFKLF
jgi:hypothetical protein